MLIIIIIIIIIIKFNNNTPTICTQDKSKMFGATAAGYVYSEREPIMRMRV